MASTDYFKSITAEISSLKNRVRHLINNAHWPTDGEWKESVVRTILRRHLPKQYGVGRGFILADTDTSRQVDVLIYDTGKPILHQDGELVIVTSDAVRGIIEVKTKITNAVIAETLQKVADNVEFVNRRHGYGSCFHGLFSYEWEGRDIGTVLTQIRDVAQGSESRRINCVSLGRSHFIRFWERPPGPPPKTNNVWRAYQLDEMSPAYFLHNVFEHLCSESVLANSSLWFPSEGKERSQIGEIQFIQRH
ncbi:MAG TPA: DUF6602 domain-containing protein [Verrucomicrobiae bacterium]|nr:DUF6602 domain-containing protein [Verrucomicrobiae bacterium]